MSGTITMTGEEYDALHAEAEALRVALLGIASVNPAERGIEWAKSYASYGLKGAGSELYARWLDTFKEAEELRAENAKLRTALTEQGERQEPFVWMRPDGDECFELTSEGDYLSFPLYRAPQPGPDVRALVEAAQAFADAARPNIYPCPDKPHSLSGKLQALDDQLSAHRQANRND